MILGGIYFLGGWKLTVTLKGEETMQVSYGSSYQEPGADGVLTRPWLCPYPGIGGDRFQ